MTYTGTEHNPPPTTDTNGYLVRASRDEEFYLLWSDIVEDVKAYYASREAVVRAGFSAERIALADANGSSCAWGTYLNYEDDWLICDQQRLQRADLKEYVLTFAEHGRDTAHHWFLTPIDDEPHTAPAGTEEAR